MTPTDPDETELPSLDSDYPLLPDQIQEYRNNGHVLLRGVASPQEVAPYRQRITGIMSEFARGKRPLSERDTYGKAFLQLGNLWVRSEAVRKFVLARRLAKIAADLMEVEGVRLYHDQALYKEPGWGPTPWHQD